MTQSHIVEMPKAYWGIKIAQLVLAVIVFALACFEVAVIPSSYAGFTIFTGLFTIVILTYYLVAMHPQPQLYNWIALLVLECVAVVFWLVVWAILAASFAVYYSYYDVYYTKRSLEKRITYGEYEAAGAVVYAILAFGVIEWILFCVTLGFLGKGVHNHRKAGRPMNASGSGSGSFNTASKEEKHDMQPMPTGQTHYAQDQGVPQYNNGVYNAAEAPANRY